MCVCMRACVCVVVVCVGGGGGDLYEVSALENIIGMHFLLSRTSPCHRTTCSEYSEHVKKKTEDTRKKTKASHVQQFCQMHEPGQDPSIATWRTYHQLPMIGINLTIIGRTHAAPQNNLVLLLSMAAVIYIF